MRDDAGSLTILKALNLALTFLLELAMLAAFAYWGFRAGPTPLARLLLGIGVPLIVAVLWGLFMAPRAARRLQGTAYMLTRSLLFGLAVAALAAAGMIAAAIVFAVVSLINTVLLYIWT
jgi:hypothetical protein